MYCVICKNDTKKYKCPKCDEYYCSLDCYKQHQIIGCDPKVRLKDKDNTEDKLVFEFRTQDTVSPEKLEELRHCEALKNLFYNPHLRNFLTEVDSAPNAYKAIKAAMQEPLFLEFADECLKVVEPKEGDEYDY